MSNSANLAERILDPARHKRVSRDMLLYKLEAAHIHLQVLGALRVSRTVQWIIESAQSKTTDLRRIAEEVGLSAIYLAAFSYWMQDHSEQQQAMRAFLRRLLRQTQPFAGLLGGDGREDPLRRGGGGARPPTRDGCSHRWIP